MRIILTVVAGPHQGLEFAFDQHDTFLVGRSRHAHFQLPSKDKYFSRIHFMMELNPPQCRLIDMGSHNGTYVNGASVLAADLKDGDQIRAGHTILRVQMQRVSDEPPTQFPAAPAAADGSLPRIKGFVLQRELGRGAMGVTYVGHRAGATVPLAIKVVAPSLQGSAAQIDAFLTQARELANLRHRSIIRLREVGACPSGFYFASDFMPGHNVAEHVERNGPLPIKRVVHLTNQLLGGLRHAHKRGVVHRDIKPANVIISEADGQEIALLGDFGTARVYQAAPFSGLCVTAAMINNASFLPPEVIYNYQEINPLADQYSLAAILYHLLTAAPVIEVPTDTRKHFSTLLRRQHVPLNERRADVPPALAAAVERALSRSPSQRFANVSEFRKAMIRAIEE
jgi:serine/threonine-protein kinase